MYVIHNKAFSTINLAQQITYVAKRRLSTLAQTRIIKRVYQLEQRVWDVKRKGIPRYLLYCQSSPL